MIWNVHSKRCRKIYQPAKIYLLSPITMILSTLQDRFEKNMHRHMWILWSEVQKHLEKSEKIRVLEQMELTGGEPDVVTYDLTTKKYIFMDCSPESPTGRRSLCYDKKALDARKENKPKGSVEDMAHTMGIQLLNENDYRYLQSLEKIDLKTSSWIHTPESVRALGGALFCDRRYDTVFTYPNGADSYYAARGWRGKVFI